MITVKTDEELVKMREAGKLTGDALKEIESSLRVGMTTKEIDDLAYRFICDMGATPSFLNYYGYPASTCISIDEHVVHGIPDDKTIIKEGQIISVDIGVFYNGYNGDAARSFYLGETSEEKKKLVEVTKQCFFKGIENLQDGSPIGDIGYNIQTYAESFGYGVVRDLVGHGIGKKMHEDPNVPNFGRKGTGIRLKKGMTIAIEPMINMGTWKVAFLKDGWGVVTADGKPSAHYENTVAITEDGVEILTL